MPTLPINATFAPFFKNENLAKAKQKKLTLDDLIVYEELHPDERVELVNGQIIPIGGTSGKHNLIANAIWAKIDQYFLEVNAKCFCYTADIRVRINNYQGSRLAETI